MKNLFLITAILINSVNLYPQDTLNLNFERPDKSSVIKLYGWSGTASVDSTTVFDGKYSIKISSGSDFKDVLFSKKIDIPQNSPFLLKIGSRIKTQISDFAVAGLFAKVTKDEKILYKDYLQSARQMGSQEWQQKELNILVDKDASGIEFGGVLSGKGIGWFDNFTFEIITSPVLSSEAQNYLDEVFQIIENNSIRIDSLDLPRYRKLVSLNASGAEKPKDCYPSIRLALNMLKYNHSFLMDPVATRDWESSTYSEDTKKAMPAGRLIAREDKQYAFISVPGMMSKNSADIDIFADSIQTLIRTLDQKV